MKQAAKGVRTKALNTVKDKSIQLRNEILREMHSALKEAQDESAIGTGLERQQRLVVIGRHDQCLQCHAFGHMACTCPTPSAFP